METAAAEEEETEAVIQTALLAFSAPHSFIELALASS